MSSTTTTEASADRLKKARVWVVKTLLTTELGFCKGSFMNDQGCCCAYGVLSKTASKNNFCSPTSASKFDSEEAKLFRIFLEENGYLELACCDTLIALNDSSLVNSHKDTGEFLKGQWGITDEEIASFTL